MTFVDRFTAANGTNLHGRTPSGSANSFVVSGGSFSIDDNAAEAGAVNSVARINAGTTDLIYSVIASTAGGTNSWIYFRWDEAGGTGWYFQVSDGKLFYYNGSSATQHAVFPSGGLPGNGDQWYIEVDLTDPASITLNVYNLQFGGDGWMDSGLVVSSTLNNDKTYVGFGSSASGNRYDCIRCQEGSYDYPYQGLFEARVQRHILQDHVPYIISLYATGTPEQREQAWGENGTYSPYYDGFHALLQLYDLWGATDGALFYEAAWKQFQITHDDYYEGANWAVQGWKPYSRGAYQLWGRMANQDAYNTVRYFPANAAYGASGDVSKDYTTGSEGVSGLHRECALALQTHVWAHKIGGVAASGLNTTRWNQLREWCYEWVDYWCDETSPGEYAWTGSGRQVAAFMCGITARCLWDDYTESADSRFPAALLKLCNFVWDNFWLPNNSPYPGLLYDCNPDSGSYGFVGVNSDLNNLITAAFAKCAQLTGVQTHMDRADTLFANLALYGSFYTGKEKNQATTWLKDYIDWRVAFSPFTPVARSGNLLRRSAA